MTKEELQQRILKHIHSPKYQPVKPKVKPLGRSFASEEQARAWIAAQSINEYVMQAPHARRPKVDVHHFDLLEKLRRDPAHLEVIGTRTVALSELDGVFGEYLQGSVRGRTVVDLSR